MEWSEEDTLRLIEEISRRDIIWDPSHPAYKVKQRKEKAVIAVANLFPPCTKEDILFKWRNLCQTYRTCRRKMKNKERNDSDTADEYIPSWFAFTSMDEMLHGIYTPLATTDVPKKLQKKDTVNQAETQSKVRRYSETGAINQVETPNTVHRRPKIDTANRAETLNMACQYSIAESIDTPRLPDECSLYGTLIAQQLRQMDELTRKHTMHDINNVIFKNSISPISSASPSTVSDVRLSSSILAQNYPPPTKTCLSPTSQTYHSPSSQISRSPSTQPHYTSFTQIYSAQSSPDPQT